MSADTPNYPSSAPFSPLPTELTELIFEYYLAGNSLRASDRTAPTLLCLVCRQWRDIVVNCPRLWSRLRITQPQIVKIDFLPTWLERSKQVPLSVGIWTRGCGYASQIAEILQSFASPKNHAITRLLEELTIDVYWVVRVPTHDEPSIDRVPFPLLRKLIVSFDAGEAVDEDMTQAHTDLLAHHYLQRIPAGAPNLTTLVWRGSPFSPVLKNMLSSPSIIDNLVEIEVGSLSIRDCITILATFTNLKTCLLEHVWDYQQHQQVVQ